MKIEKLHIDQVTPDPGNVRKHSQKNIDAIKASLNRFGQQKPIVCDNKMCVRAGNGTLQAAKELGWTHINVVVSELDRADLIAYGIADNRTAELAEWDIEGLTEQLAGLDEELRDIAYDDFDLSDLDEDEVKEGKTDDDAVPEVEDNPSGVELGDIWQLGNHRIMCGDSTSKEMVDKLMDGQKADMVFTDPPYPFFTFPGANANYEMDYEIPEFEKWACHFRSILKENSDIFVMSNNRNIKRMMSVLEDNGFKLHNILIMLKNTGFPHQWYTANHEFVLYYYQGKSILPVKQCKSSIFDVKMPTTKDKVHKSQKPTSMISEILENHPFKTVYEPFLGSGSTLIACEKTNRKCYGMELEPHYMSVVIKRWEEFTGQKAEKIN